MTIGAFDDRGTPRRLFLKTCAAFITLLAVKLLLESARERKQRSVFCRNDIVLNELSDGVRRYFQVCRCLLGLKLTDLSLSDHRPVVRDAVVPSAHGLPIMPQMVP